ncbi:phosphatidylglycerophosphatase A [Planctomycetota bacterium]|nr:phosphatidylglycerophosphatase A [Planctomycetota bacterium]
MAFLRKTDPPLSDPLVFAGSFGYSGFVGPMRGTSGTFAALLIALGMFYGRLADLGSVFLVIAAGSAFASYVTGDLLINKRPDQHDPGWFVLDEVAGFFLCSALIGPQTLLDICAAFLVFRYYDIAKPWPVKSFERIPGSAGILFDDLAAGVLAAFTVIAAKMFLM